MVSKRADVFQLKITKYIRGHLLAHSILKSPRSTREHAPLLHGAVSPHCIRPELFLICFHTTMLIKANRLDVVSIYRINSLTWTSRFKFSFY